MVRGQLHQLYLVVDFQQSLEVVLNIISSQKYPCVVAGDMNIDLCKCEHDKQTADFVNRLLLHNFLPTVIMPTRITSTSATLIDHIHYFEGLNSKRNVKTKSGNLLHDLSDHLPNYTLIVKHKIDYMKDRPMLRLFQKTNKESFARSLEQADWNKVYNESDINVAYNAFSNTIKKTLMIGISNW